MLQVISLNAGELQWQSVCSLSAYSATFCACPMTEPGFATSYVIFLMCSVGDNEK